MTGEITLTLGLDVVGTCDKRIVRMILRLANERFSVTPRWAPYDLLEAARVGRHRLD